MNKEFYVYADYRLDNMTVCYIGKGKGDRCDIAERNSHHDNIMNKYGIVRVKLYENLTESRALLLEKSLIAHYVYTLGYSIDIKGFKKVKGYHLTNRTFGGEGISGLKHSDMTRQKMSESQKGKTLSEEHRRKLSESKKGKTRSEETRKKIGESHKGKTLSEETRKKLSESNKGKTGANCPNSIPIIAFTNSGSFYKEFACAKDAERELGINQGNICECCKGKRKSAGKIIVNGKKEKLRWYYKE